MIRPRHGVLLLWLLFFFPILSEGVPPDTTGQNTLRFVKVLAEKGYYQDAIYEYFRFLVDSRQTEITDSLGFQCFQGLYRTRQYQDFDVYYELLMPISFRNPKMNTAFRILVGDNRFRMRRYQDAMDIYQSLLKTSYNDEIPVEAEKLNLRIATTHAYLGKYDLARSYINKNPQIDPAYEKALKKLSDYTGYSPHLAKAFSLFPGGGYFYLNRADTGLSTFMLTSVFAIVTYEGMRKKYYTAATLTGFMGVSWYVGSFFGASKMCKDINRREKERLLKELSF